MVTMARFAICLAVVALVVLADTISAGPLYGSGSFSQASAQSGSFRGAPPRPPVPVRPARPSFGNQRPGLNQGRNPTGGISISSSKSISIGGGSSSASSNARAGK